MIDGSSEREKVRSLVFATGFYPTRADPNRGTFVRQIVHSMAELGVTCTVIHPRNLRERIAQGFGERCDEESDLRAGVQVLRPLMLSFSNRRFGPWNTFALTCRSFQHAASRTVRRRQLKPDAVYGHFLYPSGATAAHLARKLGCAGFVAVGEGTFWTLRGVRPERVRRDFGSISGAIAVSSLLERRLVGEVGFPPDRVAVFPNGVDLRRFFPRSQQEVRHKYGLPKDLFLVVYVGNFIEPKGVERVARAIDGLPGVAGMFVGGGPLSPRISNLAFCGAVPHEQVPELLSAADCFVLPSDVEGSSNATVEAMACGLPVIVSDGEFNDDVFSSEVGIRVPARDVTAIRNAILRLRDESAFRMACRNRALAAASVRDIRQRAKGILSWMSERGCAQGQATGR